MATGTDARNATRPDHRWNVPIQDGALMNDTLPYMTSAEPSCSRAPTAATVASQTLTVSGLEKPATLTAIPVGVCVLPYIPSVSATAPPTMSGTSSPMAFAVE